MTDQDTSQGKFYMLEQGETFTGSANLLINGRVAYTGYGRPDSLDMTLAEYEAEHGKKHDLYTVEQMEKMFDDFLAGMVTDPEEITETRYWDRLNCLPPCKWGHLQGVEFFHISERLFANQVSWVGKVGEQYFEFTDYDNRPREEIAAKFAAAAK